MSHRVVVTGLGVIHNLGEDAHSFFDAVVAGRSGLSRVQSFDPSDYTCQVGAEHMAFRPEDHMDPKEARRSDRNVQFAVAASKKAVADSQLDLAKVDHDRMGVIIGSGIGGMRAVEEAVVAWHTKGPRKVSPFSIPMLISNMASGVVGIELQARGPNYGVVSACASSSHAIGDAFKMLRDGEVDVMVTGGTEAAITPVSYAGFCSMKAMATDFNTEPTRASRPFDVARCGFVMGEGSAVLVLETLEHAQARGAHIYAEIVGYGASCDGYHITQPDPEGRGLVLCMTKALKMAGITPEQVGYVNAHGTSTPYNDKFETLAIKKVFGDYAKAGLKVSSTKSETGHLLGAAGAIEAIISILAMKKGILPPTINLENVDPDCDLDYIPNKAIAHQVDYAISNNLGFGGQNACLAFKRWQA